MARSNGAQYKRTESELRRYISQLISERSPMLPPETTLMAQLGVGRNTLRDALGTLADEGLVERIQGKGTFIVTDSRRVTVSGWVKQDPGAETVLDAMIEGFERSRNIRVDYLSVPFYQYPKKMLQLCMQGKAPDIIQVNPYWLPQFHNMDQLIPLDGLIKEQNLTKRYTSDIESGRIGAHTYAINWSLCPLVLYYNKAVMKAAGLDPDRPPTTLQELLQFSKTVTEAGNKSTYGIALPLAPNAPHFHWIYPFLLSHGGGFSDSVGNVIIDSEPNVEGIAWLAALIRQAGILQPLRTEDVRILFSTHRIAFMIDSSYGRGLIRQISGKGDAADEFYGIAKIPIGKTGKSESVLLTHALSISRQCRDPQLAYEWIDYLTSDVSANRLYFDHYGMIPCLRDMLNDEHYRSDPFASTLVEQVETASVVPLRHPLYSRALPFMAHVFSDIILNGRDPRQQLRFLKDVLAIVGQDDTAFPITP